MFGKKEKNPDTFWQEYEEQTGEKVLSRSLGRYISGWEEFDSKRLNNIWGLIIATSGGFRFHHFPQQSWLMIFTQFSSREAPKEKTIFIPKEDLISAKIFKESAWWKKIFAQKPPLLTLVYRDATGNEKQLLLEVDYYNADKNNPNLVETLQALPEPLPKTAPDHL